MINLNQIHPRARVPLVIGGGALLLGIGSRILSPAPVTETFEIQTAAVEDAIATEPETISDPYAECQQRLNAALIALQSEQDALNGPVAAGRGQDWRRWARERAQSNGSSEVQELRAAFSAITAQIDQRHLTTAQTVGGQVVSSDTMDIGGNVGAWRDLEGSRLDIALALATAQTTPYESTNTTALRNAAGAFADASGCLVGMEVVNVD